MDKIIALVAGALCGIAQFFVIRYTLKSITNEGNPKIVKGMFLKAPIPIALLLGCAFINSNLLHYAGGAFCLSLITAGVYNHLVTIKKKG